jgi:hypothetical protein
MFDQGKHGSTAGQANSAFIFGILLLLTYAFTIGMLKILKNHPNINAIFFVMAILSLSVNTLFASMYFPYMVASAQYGENTYYLTSNNPFLECCGYYQITKWQGRVHYESFFYGYNLRRRYSSAKMKEVGLMENFTENSRKVYITIGQECQYYRRYDPELGTQLGKHLYYYDYSECTVRTENIFEISNFFIYECELDKTLCTKLMRYTTEYDEGVVDLEVNKLTNEVDFYLGTKLIYTYGQHPHCLVDGCSIAGK